MRTLSRIAWAGFGLAGALLVVAVVIAFQPNFEGWLGGLLFAGFYAVPVALIALSVKASRSWVRTAGAWVAAALAVYYAAIPVGNWSGYTGPQAVLAVSITAPTVVYFLAVFWTVVVRHAGRSRATIAT